MDLNNSKNWEHLLIGEPIESRISRPSAEQDDADIELMKTMEEKHLDLPAPWSLRIHVPYEGLNVYYYLNESNMKITFPQCSKDVFQTGVERLSTSTHALRNSLLMCKKTV